MRWGDPETTTKVQKRRLEWLGHLARMPEHRMPKITLFSWLPQTRPCCGPRDVVKKDMKDVGIGVGCGMRRRRTGEWYEAYSEGAVQHQNQQ